MVNFDSSVAPLASLRELLNRDLDIVRPRILRKEQELGRPCERAPCEFGELTDDLRQRLLANIREHVVKL